MSNDLHAWQGFLGAALIVAACAACGDESARGGGLEVVVETDLAAPKDIDAIRFEVQQRGAVVRSEELAVGPGQTLLPLHFRVAPSGDASPVMLRAFALKATEIRIERHAVLPIPRARLALLHMPLNYLCAGSVSADGGSTCEPPQTCAQGTCVDPTDALSVSALTDGATTASPLEGTGAAPEPMTKAGAGQCFDVLGCFATFTAVVPDADTCTLEAPPIDPLHLNVALALLPSSEGICNDTGCFIVLDDGPGGFRVEANRIRLPPAICRASSSEVPRAVVLSSDCLSKTSSTPPCGDWSAAQMPLGPGFATTLPPDVIGPACVGASSERCGNCGVRTRTCDGTTWSPWSPCAGEGVCSPDTTRACGMSGTQQCDARCSFGECMGQSCSGPTAEACGHCGTHTRSCQNGTWSEWSACSGEGACAPNETQECGSQGTEVCGGACQWGACTHQVCSGAGSEACGHCGTRSRVCDEMTATWSEWSACSGEGECDPNETRSCGHGGSQSCGGDCHWSTACGGQQCDGPFSQGCGQCGMQTRSCNSDTGETTNWSQCEGQGACAPGDTMQCGQRGMRVCGPDCRFPDVCDGQICDGPPSEPCGNCGMRTRRCDPTTGRWSIWSACMNEGECAPGTTTRCASDSAEAALVRTCNRTCHYGECGCAAPREACGGLCVDLASDANNCGACGNACRRGYTCASHRCTCDAPLLGCPESCVDPRMDAANCGTCGHACLTGQRCQDSQCVCPMGTRLCGNRCADPMSDASACGEACITCLTGQSCSEGLCVCPAGTELTKAGCQVVAR